MDITRAASEWVKVWIAFGGITLLLMWTDLPRRRARVLLAVLCLVSVLNYARWGPKVLVEHIDSYDVMHYYLSAKYFDELGYFDLYPAILQADREHPDGPFPRRLRHYRSRSSSSRPAHLASSPRSQIFGALSADGRQGFADVHGFSPHGAFE